MNKVSILGPLLMMCDFLGIKGFKKKKWMNYILLWTSDRLEPFKHMAEGQDTFIKSKCPFKNCFVTYNRGLFEKISEFDIVLFNAPNMNAYYNFPRSRSFDQKYVFVSSEPAMDYPIPGGYEGFFNWTWTYRLDSDIPFLYVIVKNIKGDVIAPKLETDWLRPNEMRTPSNFIKWNLRNKKIAIAWIRTNCYAASDREDFVFQLQKELALYELSMDIYGHCGENLHCTRHGRNSCAIKLRTDYYFYLALENAFCEDYVTDKILLALNNYAVPVVYGGANYSRFMPDGIYLNGYELGVAEVVRQMNYAILDKKKYYNYFRWHTYYTFHRPEESEDTNNYCTFCTSVNNITRRVERSFYYKLAEWWNPPMNKQNQTPIYVPVVKILKDPHLKKKITYKNSKVNHIHRYSLNSIVNLPIGSNNSLDSIVDPDCYDRLNKEYNYEDLDAKLKPYVCRFSKKRWKKPVSKN